MSTDLSKIEAELLFVDKIVTRLESVMDELSSGFKSVQTLVAIHDTKIVQIQGQINEMKKEQEKQYNQINQLKTDLESKIDQGNEALLQQLEKYFEKAESEAKNVKEEFDGKFKKVDERLKDHDKTKNKMTVLFIVAGILWAVFLKLDDIARILGYVQGT